MKLGIIGCGNISGIYLKNAQRFRNIETIAVADNLMDRAKAKADEFGVPKTLTTDQLLADPDVEIVLNLTVPNAHAEIALAALEAGKHVYNEKPLAVSRELGRKMLEVAKAKGLRVGCAPDTFLGAGMQSCRKLIDDGAIGRPVAATGFMLSHGPERWHPDPEFFYKPGGGPLLDMGPYYVTALVTLIGGVGSVAASSSIGFPTRTIGSGAKKDQEIVVETPTHVAGTLNFAQGAIGTLVTSFDVWGHQHSNIEIYGTEGSLRVADPNGFGGAALVLKAGTRDWVEMPLTHSFAENSRGVGIADMAAAIVEGRPHRASGELAYHVLDIMLSLLDASELRRHVDLTSGLDRPAPLPIGLPEDSVTP
jgi:predicted dehydrogenase